MSDILQTAKKQVENGVSLGADQVEVYIVSQSQARKIYLSAHPMAQKNNKENDDFEDKQPAA